MPVRALSAVSTARNGYGAYILQCKRLDFHYSDWAGSSEGLKNFLRSRLFKTFTSTHPQIQIHISPRGNHHPIIRGLYINGREKVICVRNLEPLGILEKVELLRNASGEQLKRTKGGRMVTSLNQGVRGIWDPFHGGNKEIIGGKIVGDERR